jgi:hypothetical protein
MQLQPSNGVLVTGETHGIVFNSNDIIYGNGSFSNYNYLDLLGIHVDNRWDEQVAQMKVRKDEHGCGYLQRQYILNSMKSVQYLTIDQSDSITNAYTRNVVSEAKKVISVPMTFSLGNGYYSVHPIKRTDLFSDLLWVKDYASETSMNQEVLMAYAMQGKLSAAVEDIYILTDKNGPQDQSRIAFRTDMSVQNGTSNLGFLQGNDEDSRWSSLVDPDLDIGQSYSGDYRMKANLTLSWPAKEEHSEDYWLDCCSGGWNSMTIADKGNFGRSAAEIFDCICTDRIS